MALLLENNLLQLEIQEPGKGYCGSRFDWTGQITQIRYRRQHTFCTEETVDPALVNKLGRGLYNEFGIDQPLGYHDCSVGDKFPKIGIGLITRDTPGPKSTALSGLSVLTYVPGATRTVSP